MYKYYIVLTAILLLTACETDQISTDNKEQSDGSISLSLEEINKKILEQPNNHHLYFKRASLHFEEKEMEAALADVDRALKLDSAVADYYLLKSNIYFITNQTRLAKESLEKCLELNPENVEALLKLAEIFLYVKKHEESVGLIDKALKLDQFNAKGYFMKGMNFKELGDTAKAISSMQTAVEQNPEYYDAFIQLGLLFASKADKAAVMYYDNALKLNPTSAEALYNKAKFLQDISAWEQSLAIYEELLKLNPNDKKVHYNIGVVTMLGKEEYTNAIPYFNKVIELDAQDYYAYYSRATCYQATGKDLLAKKDYRMALQINPSFTPAAEALNAMQ